MGEADDILQELRVMLLRVVHLESKETDFDDVVAEDECAQNVCVFAVFLRNFVRVQATGHQLQNVQNLEEKLHRCVELFVRNFFEFIFDVRFLYRSPVQSAVEKVEGMELKRDANQAHVDLEGDLRQFRLRASFARELVLFF